MIEITKEEAEKFAWAWTDPKIPKEQYEMVVKNEIEGYKRGKPCLPYNAFVQCLLKLPKEIDKPETTMLEVGAASGYYSEVLKAAGFKYSYTAFDYSPFFMQFAKGIYPQMPFVVGDATNIQFKDDSYDIVVSGCCILHIPDYVKAIEEARRVSKKYVLFHRTPFRLDGRTVYYKKKAYGVECMEIHFSEQELMELFTKLGLKMIHVETLFFDKDMQYGHRSYMLSK